MLSSCSLRNSPKAQNTTTLTTTTIKVENPPNQVYDYDIKISDNARDVPPLYSLSPDIEKIFRVENKKNVESVFEIPQLNIRERLGANEVKYISVWPVRIGYYQMQINGASYGTFQVK